MKEKFIVMTKNMNFEKAKFYSNSYMLFLKCN